MRQITIEAKLSVLKDLKGLSEGWESGQNEGTERSRT